MKRLIHEVHRRSLWQVLLIYVAGAWAAFEAIDAITERLFLPEWLPVGAIILFLIGLPIVLATAFIQESPSASAETDASVPPGTNAPHVDPAAVHRRGLFTWRNALVGGVLAFALLGLIAAGVLWFRDDEAVTHAEAEHPVAVLPFTARGADLEHWPEGMVDVLTSSISGAPGLDVVSSRTVLALWSRVTRDQPVELAEALAIAGRAGARYAVIGTIVRTGAGVRIDAELYVIDSRKRIDAAHVQGHYDEMPALIEALSVDLVRKLAAAGIMELPNFNAVAGMTSSVEALKAYLEGEVNYRRSNWEAAAQAYERAIGLDSTFAMAHDRLISAYGWADGGRGRAPEASNRARRLLGQSPLTPVMQVRLGLIDRVSPPLIELAEQAVRERPRDAQLWNQLGELYAHYGGAYLVEPGREVSTLERAIAIDSGMTPAYAHAIQKAFRETQDSALSSDMIRAMERHGAAAAEVADIRAFHAIAFGDSSARRRAYAAIGDRPLTPAAPARWLLAHPAFLPQRAEVLRLANRRRDSLEPGFSNWLIVRTAFDRGRLEEALRELRGRKLPPVILLPTIHRAWSQGLPLPPELVDSIMQMAVPDTVLVKGEGGVYFDGGTIVPLFYVAAYRIERGQTDAARAVVARLQAAEARHRAAGDTARARVARGAAAALEGFDAWKSQGDTDRALRILEQVQRGDLFDAWQSNRTIRWWLGLLNSQRGRYDKAVLYFRSLAEAETTGLFDPPAAYRLAQTHEQLGNVDEARRAYAYFALAWRDADAALKPMVRKAEASLMRLGSDR